MAARTQHCTTGPREVGVVLAYNDVAPSTAGGGQMRRTLGDRALVDASGAEAER